MAQIQNTDGTKCRQGCGAGFSLIAGGKGTLEDGLVISYKTDPSHHTIGRCALRHLPNGAEKFCPHKILHTDIYGSFIQTWKQPGVFQKANEQTGVSRQWTLIHHKKETSY